jgi:hypothetical protein
MTASDPAETGGTAPFPDLAGTFRTYLSDQTGLVLPDPGVVDTLHGPVALRAALEALDAAVNQLADLASIYAEGPVAPLEPLALPIAALAGEYIRAHLAARWHAEPDQGEGALLVLPAESEPRVLDLLALVRAMLASGALHLATLVPAAR